MSLAARGSLEPQGPVAQAMADLWWLMLALGAVVFLLFAVLLVRGLRRIPGEAGDAGEAAEAGSGQTRDGDPAGVVRRWVVLGGVAMPFVVLVIVFGATVAAMRVVPTDAPADALVVEVTGHQFHWQVRYPGHDVELTDQLHIPVGRPVALQLTSADVIHSFWVPALGGKLDALPDGVNTLVLHADQPGRYRGHCAEFCGLHHADMTFEVIAEPAAQFDAWIARQQEVSG